MFKAVRVAVVASLAVLAVATPTPDTTQSCSTGSLTCCDSTQSADSPTVTNLLSLLGIVIEDILGLVGLTCSPITGVGVGGTSCTSQTVCCENDTFNGLIAIGCTPITIDL